MSDHLIAEANRHARAFTIERDQIRTELALLREWQREVIQNANAHHAERKDAITRAERAEAELGKLRGFYNEIVAECGHDLIVREYRQRGELLRDEANRRKEAEVELATERARLNWLEKRGPWESFNKWGETGISLRENVRAAIDAAMKEETK